MLLLPYGTSEIPFEEGDAAVLCSRIDMCDTAEDGRALVRAAMESPFGGRRLSELAVGKKSCTLILSDHTRPVPSRDIVPEMLCALRANNPDICVTLLVATGFHRGTTAAELEQKLGAEICRRERIVVHDGADPAKNVQIGILPSGAPLCIDRLAAETELLIAEGFIEPHFFAGFSGGRKSVLPGVCSRETVLGNHCGQMIGSSFARTGVTERNPIHADMLAAAKMARLAYIVNVVIDGEKRTVAAFAGEPETAHEAGCAFLRSRCEVEAVPSDIVLTTNGGAPLDQNIYQCVKGLTAAEATAKEDAVLIIAAACEDGVGGDGFYRILHECASPAALYAEALYTPREATRPDQWQSQILVRILMRHTVIVVTRPALAGAVTAMKMRYAPTVEDALMQARAIRGKAATLTVIPNGVSVIVHAQS